MDLKYFKESEFPLGVIPKMDSAFLIRMDNWREKLGELSPKAFARPSPLKGGWIREDGSETSRHYVGGGRLSDAGDLFLFGGVDQKTAFLAAMMTEGINGFGVYYDTQWSHKKTLMVHLDSRPSALIWARHKGKYIYPHKSIEERELFFKLLNGGQ